MSRSFSLFFIPGVWCCICWRSYEWGVCAIDVVVNGSSSVIQRNTQNLSIMGYYYLLRSIDHTDVISELEGTQHSSEDSESQGSGDPLSSLFSPSFDKTRSKQFSSKPKLQWSSSWSYGLTCHQRDPVTTCQDFTLKWGHSVQCRRRQALRVLMAVTLIFIVFFSVPRAAQHFSGLDWLTHHRVLVWCCERESLCAPLSSTPRCAKGSHVQSYAAPQMIQRGDALSVFPTDLALQKTHLCHSQE